MGVPVTLALTWILVLVASYVQSQEVLCYGNKQAILQTASWGRVRSANVLAGMPFPRSSGLAAFLSEPSKTGPSQPEICKTWLERDSPLWHVAQPVIRVSSVEMPDQRGLKIIAAKSYSLQLPASVLPGVKTARVFVNGTPTLELEIDTKEETFSVEVPLVQGLNKIGAITFDRSGFSSSPRYVDILCTAPDLPKPNLYVLGVGISKYPNLPSGMQLDYAHTDAQHIVEAFKKQEGRVFGGIYTCLLTNEDATKEKITNALQALSAIEKTDLAIIFLCGHEVVSKDGTFYFLTHAANFDEPERAGLCWKHLAESFSRMRGRVVLLLDTPHSGAVSGEAPVPEHELTRQLMKQERSGFMVFTACKATQKTMESPDLEGGAGVFAYALCQALGPRAKDADSKGNGFVEFSELVEFVTRLVHLETDGRQTPWLARRELFGDFPVAKVEMPR